TVGCKCRIEAPLNCLQRCGECACISDVKRCLYGCRCITNKVWNDRCVFGIHYRYVRDTRCFKCVCIATVPGADLENPDIMPFGSIFWAAKPENETFCEGM